MPQLESALGVDADKGKAMAQDGRAEDEARLYHETKMELKSVFHGLFIKGLKFAWFIAMIVLAVRAYDLIAPLKYIWMDDEQIQSLDKILFSGAVGGVMGKYLNQVLPNDSKKDKEKD
jgi:hypothetical protein